MNGLLPGTQNFDSNARALPSISNNPTIPVGNPGLTDPFNHENPNYRPLPGSLALTLAPALQPNDGFFELAQFIGALSPDPALDWTVGWTDYSGR
jgi:hypothetical protein